MEDIRKIAFDMTLKEAIKESLCIQCKKHVKEDFAENWSRTDRLNWLHQGYCPICYANTIPIKLDTSNVQPSNYLTTKEMRHEGNLKNRIREVLSEQLRSNDSLSHS